MNQPLLRADARANRIRLIEAAHEVFRERGLDAEMREIAERAGVGIATLYRNFPTREDLVAAMVAEVVAQMRMRVAAALELADPIEALRRLLQGGFGMLDQYGDLMSIFHQSMPRDHTRDFAEFRELVLGLTDLIKDGCAAGIFRKDLDAELAAMRILTSFLPPLYRHLRQTRSLDEIVDAQMDLLLHGMLSDSR